MSEVERREVLVVDDDPLVVDFLSDALEDAGYLVRRTYDGLSALEEIERMTPDLVVADIVMPCLDGVRLAQRVLSRPDPVPVVLMSAARKPPAGAELPFVRKPFDIDVLLATIVAAFAAAPRSSRTSDVVRGA
jgi:two-component system response regulator MprA